MSRPTDPRHTRLIDLFKRGIVTEGQIERQLSLWEEERLHEEACAERDERRAEYSNEIIGGCNV